MLIFESIGTAELLLIGLVALIFFGPRKLPEFARTLGKWRAELRKTTDEFKNTWEKEVASEVNQFKTDIEQIGQEANPNALFKEFSANVSENFGNTIEIEAKPAMPEIREVSQEDFDKLITAKTQEKAESPNELEEKRNWL